MKLFLIKITTPLKLKSPYTWFKYAKRKVLRKSYDTVCFSIEIGKDIMIFEATFLGYVKATDLKEWKKSKYPSQIIPMNKPNDKIKKYL